MKFTLITYEQLRIDKCCSLASVKNEMIVNDIDRPKLD